MIIIFSGLPGSFPQTSEPKSIERLCESTITWTSYMYTLTLGPFSQRDTVAAYIIMVPVCLSVFQENIGKALFIGLIKLLTWK